MRRALTTTVALLAALALAPAAGAAQYRFAGSDGTSCVVDTSRAATAQAGGTWTVGFGASLSCNRGLFYAHMGTGLERVATDEAIAGDGETCNTYLQPDFVCDAWPVEVGTTVSDLPAERYRHVTTVTLQLLGSVEDRTPAWVLTPTHRAKLLGQSGLVPAYTDCRPGGKYVSCYFVDEFIGGSP